MTRPHVIAQAIGAYELHPCRGLQGACPFALVNDPPFAGRIDLAIRASVWWQRFGERGGTGPAHHSRLRVALAACPNACTMPQIRDIGIIARLTPQSVGAPCNGCGCCERTCREEAIMVHEGRAELCKDRCVGCGQCIRSCPSRMIQPGSVRAQVLVGGRMGRHPRWAQELRDVDIAAAAEVVKAFLDCIGRESRPDERVADAVQRISLERLRCQPAYVTGSGVLASEE